MSAANVSAAGLLNLSMPEKSSGYTQNFKSATFQYSNIKSHFKTYFLFLSLYVRLTVLPYSRTASRISDRLEVTGGDHE